MGQSSRILFVEDNPTTSKMVLVFLEAEGYRTTWVSSGGDAIEVFRAASFDLVLLDLMLPDVDGYSVCREIRTESSVPIVILSARSTEDEIVRGLECGADDYVCKPFGSKELMARIRRCLRISDRTLEASDMIRLGELELELSTRVVRKSGQAISLTRTEFEILDVMIRQPGRVFTRAQLIQKALGHDFEGQDRTIDTHVWNLRKKLGEPKGSPEYILSELGVGYRMSDRHAK